LFVSCRYIGQELLFRVVALVPTKDCPSQLTQAHNNHGTEYAKVTPEAWKQCVDVLNERLSDRFGNDAEQIPVASAGATRCELSDPVISFIWAMLPHDSAPVQVS
jgi:hypothetical protein